MSVYPNVTMEDVIELAKLLKQQKNQRAIEMKIKILKQTHQKQLAETVTPITRKLSKTTEAIQKLSFSEAKNAMSIQPTKNTQNHSREGVTEGIVHDTSLEHTIENIKKLKTSS